MHWLVIARFRIRSTANATRLLRTVIVATQPRVVPRLPGATRMQIAEPRRRRRPRAHVGHLGPHQPPSPPAPPPPTHPPRVMAPRPTVWVRRSAQSNAAGRGGACHRPKGGGGKTGPTW